MGLLDDECAIPKGSEEAYVSKLHKASTVTRTAKRATIYQYYYLPILPPSHPQGLRRSHVQGKYCRNLPNLQVPSSLY